MIYKLLLDGFDIFNQQDDRKLLNSNVSIELNAAGSCEFTMPVSHRYYDLVSLLNQTLEIYDENNTVIWFGRPTEITTDFYNQKKVYFEGPMAFFGDTIQRPVEQFNYSVRQFFIDLITAHNSQVTDPNRQFTVGNITIPDRAVYRKTDYETTKECLERMCIDAEGGYIFFRRESGVNYIDWLDYPSTNSNQPIVYAMNLKDIEQNLNCDDLITAVIPLGKEDETTGVKLDIKSVNAGVDYLINTEAESVYGRIFGVAEYSEIDDPTKLKNEGEKYLTDKQYDRLSLDVSSADISYINSEYSSFRLGDLVHVLSTPHIIDRTLPITQISFSFDDPVKDITIGTTKRPSLTEIYYEG